jgi:O-antigen ligase
MRLGCGDVPLVLAVLLVAFAVSPAFVDCYTSVKWYALQAVAAAWLLSERLLCGSRGLPAFVRRRWLGCAALAAWVVGGSLRQGPAWAAAPLLARASFVALVVSAYWSFRRSGLRLEALRGSVALASAIVVALGLLQMSGLRPLPWLAGGDQRSATFGNVNMAAQFAGLALVVQFSRSRGPGEATGRRIIMEVLGVGGFGYVVLAGTRSVAVSLLAAFVVLALVRRTVASLVRAGFVLAATLVVVLAPLARPETVPLGPPGSASKVASARWRLAVWSDTLDLVRDRPLGVGAGNFEHAFIPYALAGRSRPGEHLVFRSPHNDYLRLLAEDGVPGAILLLALFLLLVRELRRAPAFGWRSDVGALLASCGGFLAVEAIFQFPFEMAFPALLAAVLLGLAFAAIDGAGGTTPVGDETSISCWGTLVVIVVVVATIAGLLRIATAEILFVSRRNDPTALERACTLDPRRVDACVQAAWLRSREGEHASARKLLEGVLRRSPQYFPAIRLLAEDRLAVGDREAGCRWVRAYEALLGDASSLAPEGCRVRGGERP